MTKPKTYISTIDGKEYPIPDYKNDHAQRFADSSRGGKKGGKAKVPKGFAANRELARIAGMTTKRGKAKS